MRSDGKMQGGTSLQIHKRSVSVNFHKINLRLSTSVLEFTRLQFSNYHHAYSGCYLILGKFHGKDSKKKNLLYEQGNFLLERKIYLS